MTGPPQTYPKHNRETWAGMAKTGVLGGSSQLVRITPIYKPWMPIWMEGEYPYLGDLLTMVINHLLTGMILQVCL